MTTTVQFTPWRRRAALGPGAVAALGTMFDQLAPNANGMVISSGSYTSEQHESIRAAAGHDLDLLTVTTPVCDGEIPGSVAAATLAGAVVGIGGGSMMDAAKLVAHQAGVPLFLVPMTLSGSEHTRNTSWWEHGTKKVIKVRYADAVVADSNLLIPSEGVRVAGALHSLAHAFMAMRQPNLPEALRRVGADGARELALGIKDLAAPSAALHLTRGAWRTAIALSATGPAIAFHHWSVHALAEPGDHARLSAYLLCRGILQTDLYDEGIARVARIDPDFPDEIRRIARTLLEEGVVASPARQQAEPATPPPAQMAREVAELLGAIR